MTVEIVHARSLGSRPDSTYSRRSLTLLVLWSLGGCSLQDFSELTSGAASNTGGTTQSGGTAANGGATSAGGMTNTGGASNAGGASNTAGANTGGASSTAGATNAGGTSSGGTSSGTSSNSTGGLDLRGCPFAQTGGQLLVPPSQGFENDLNGWTTTSQKTAALKRAPGNSENCEGNWYMSCDGTRRDGAWDGPAIEVGMYVTLGRTYQCSVAARRTPSSSSSAAIDMKLVVSTTCTTTAYSDFATASVSTSWVRLTGQFTLSAGCTAPSSVRLYIASLEGASPYSSFDVDDFKLIDLSPPATGSGGASSTGGAAATGGASSTGGAAATGGASSTGGAAAAGGTSS
jgi:hypothetical protein